MAARKPKRRGNGEGTIYERKPGQWAAAITDGINLATGKPKRRFLYGKTRDEVRDKLRELQNQQATGTIATAGKLTVGEWMNTWLDYYKKHELEETTFENYRQQVDAHIIPGLGKIQMKKLTTTDIQRFYVDLSENGNRGLIKDEKTGKMKPKGGRLAPSTVLKVHNLLKQALEKAKEVHKINDNPAAAASPPKQERKTMKVLEREDVQTVVTDANHYRYYASYVFAIATGCRRGEVIGLPWDAVDLGSEWSVIDTYLPWQAILDLPKWNVEVLLQLLQPRAEYLPFLQDEAAYVTIRQSLALIKGKPQLKDTKTEQSTRMIEIPISAALTLIFQRAYQRREKEAYEAKHPGQCYNPADMVFCTKNGTFVPPRGYSRNFQMMLKTVGVQKVRFHDMRHTHGTVLTEDGTPLVTVSERLGHSDPTFTAKQYGHVTKKMRSDATGKIENLLSGGKKKEE